MYGSQVDANASRVVIEIIHRDSEEMVKPIASYVATHEERVHELVFGLNCLPNFKGPD